MKLASMVVGVALVVVATQAFAFGTISTLGQNEEHEKITRAALPFLGVKTLDEIAGKTRKIGAVGAPDFLFMDQGSAHCDGGDYLGLVYPQSQVKAQKALEACRDWIFRSLDEAVLLARPLADPDPSNTALDDCKKSASVKCRVLEQLGRAFHAAQDFYSHTNWTDKTSGPISVQNPPGLGNKGVAPFIDPRIRGGFPPGLISGCFEGWPEAGYCHNRVKHAYLNKDTGPIGPSGVVGTGKTTKRGEILGNFKSAVEAAITDTKLKYEYFELRVGEVYGKTLGEEAVARIRCAMRRDDPTPCRKPGNHVLSLQGVPCITAARTQRPDSGGTRYQLTFVNGCAMSITVEIDEIGIAPTQRVYVAANRTNDVFCYSVPPNPLWRERGWGCQGFAADWKDFLS